MKKRLSRLVSEVDLLRNATSQKGMSPKVVQAMNKIAMLPELRGPLGQAACESIKSCAVEFGGNVTTVTVVNGALGLVAELQRSTNVWRYGSVGLSLGASVGATGDLALRLYTSCPEDYGGPFIASTLQGAFAIGGGIVDSFDLPDSSFGGGTISFVFSLSAKGLNSSLRNLFSLTSLLLNNMDSSSR
jgi:hypothetical protein